MLKLIRLVGFSIVSLHILVYTLSKIIKKDLVFYLSKINFDKDKICDACQLDKQTRVFFKSKNIVLTSKPLELLHIDLFDPTRMLV